MHRPIISYGLDERYLAEAAGSYISLRIEDLVFSAEYWCLRAASSAFSIWGWLRVRPLAIVAGFLVLAGSAMALNVHNIWCEAQRTAASLDLESIANTVARYRTETGQLPARLEDLAPKYLNGLRADPWGRNYVLYRGAGGAAVVSAGPDGALGTTDDLVRLIDADGFVVRSTTFLLKAGDVVRSVAATPIHSSSQFYAALAAAQLPIDLDVERQGRHFTMRALTPEALKEVMRVSQ
jgi:hypothetical protein